MTRADGEILDRVIERLCRLRGACGSAAFQAAAGRALVAIARTALEEAERRAASLPRKPSNVIRFPVERRSCMSDRIEIRRRDGRADVVRNVVRPSSPPTPTEARDSRVFVAERGDLAESPSPSASEIPLSATLDDRDHCKERTLSCASLLYRSRLRCSGRSSKNRGRFQTSTIFCSQNQTSAHSEAG
jgi:hypothetical protein